MIQNVARSHWTQGMWRFKYTREKRYITAACELSVTRLPHKLAICVEFIGVNTSALILGTFRESE